MVVIPVSSLQGGYDVVVEGGVLGRLEELCAERGLSPPAAVASNVTVGPLWARRLATGLGAAIDELPDGERHKGWPAVEGLCGAWLGRGLHRSQLVAAVGGGVVTDIVGFAAAVYLRGIAWIAAPTTLLGMVDAAIGGKTGVNLPQGKNLVGAFWPPRLVVADPSTLQTLPPRELKAGLAEVVKSAWIGDHDLLGLMPERLSGWSDLDPEGWRSLVAGATQVKARVVSADEREAGPRQALNLGHTLGHALETVTGYERFLHGEAVARGMAAVAVIARRRGLLSGAASSRLERALAVLEPLPPISDLAPERLLEVIARDKKRDDLGVAWVLPTDDGVRLGERVTADEVRQSLAELGADARGAQG